jgi:hypothetical protein
MSLNSMGIFVLAFYAGRGLLSRGQEYLLVALTSATFLVIATGLILASAAIVIAMFFLGYMLGSSRVPWKGLLVVFVVLAVLHPGKFAMRDAYWLQGKERVTLFSMPSFYADWAMHGFEELGGIQGILSTNRDEGEVSSIFERGGTIHMLLLVQKKTPSEVPFFNGLSYEFIPRLLVPRFIDDLKGGPHAANIMLTVNYGLQTLEQTQTTSIGWGLVPEAYANFGYVGVAAVAAVVAAFYAFVSRLTVGVPMTSLSFVIGLLIMAVAVRADTMALFVTMQFQSVMGVSLAAVVLMRRQANPFAEEQELEVKSGKVGRWEERQQGARSEEHGAGNAVTAPRDVGTGGTVRTMPIRTPKRIARWMPRRLRAAVVAQNAAEEEPEGTERPKDGSEKPRQLAVPYQNYRRYRG